MWQRGNCINRQRPRKCSNCSKHVAPFQIIEKPLDHNSSHGLMIVLVSRGNGSLVKWHSSVSNGRRKSFSNYWHRAVNLNVIQTCGFDQGGLLHGHSFDLCRRFHDVHFLQGLDRSANYDATRGHTFVGWLSVVWSWGCRDHSSPNLASIVEGGFRETRKTTEIYLQKVRLISTGSRDQ